MAKALPILSWVNHVDRAGAVLTASQQAGDLSVANLANPIVGRRWRTTDLTGWGQVDFGAEVTVGVLALRLPRDTALPAGGSIAHALDPDGGTAGAGAAYSSGSVALGIADGYGYHVDVLPAPVTARTWRFTFAVLGVTFLDVGRAWAGEAWRPSHGISFGYEDEWADLSRVSRSERSGAEFADPRARQRLFAFGLDGLDEDEANDVREMQRIAGTSQQVLLVKDPAAWSTETILGRLAASTPIRHRDMPVFSKAFTVRESL